MLVTAMVIFIMIHLDVQIPPEDEQRIAVTVLPLSCGSFKYPAVTITWLRQSMDILNTALDPDSRYVFVYPREINEIM